MAESFYIKTNRTFTTIRKYGWIFTLLVAFGGLWYPKLGLMVIPVMLSLTIMSFLKGRYWCGNFCPHGSLFDSLILPISRNAKIPSFFKSKIFGGLFFAWFTINLIRKFIKVSALFGTLPFWDKLGFIFVGSYLMVTILGGTLSIVFAPRTWCQFCPMGILQRLSYAAGKLIDVTKKTDQKISISHTDFCHSCGKCSRVCPMQLVPFAEFSDKNQLDNDVCIRCSTCVENCPAGVLKLSVEEEAIAVTKQVDLTGYDNRQKIQARISNIRQLKNDVTEYSFKFELPKKVEYKAGQFILVKIQDIPEMYRAYSISSYNEDGTGLSVTVKKMEDGYGTNIISNTFKVGDKVQLAGPMGRELIVDKTAEKVLLVAGGIGITPFLPIVRDLVENKSNVKEFKLIYGVNKQNEFIYDEEFKKLAAKSDKFEYIKVAAFDENWKGKKGFVTDVMKEMDLSAYKIYMCGPKPMVNATEKVLTKMDFDKKNLFCESA